MRNLVRAGVPERVATIISGHKTRAVFDRYNIVSEADLKDAARRLDAYMEWRAKADGAGTPQHDPEIGTYRPTNRKAGLAARF